MTRETARKRIRVLCIEDSPDDQELVLIELRRGGYQVEHERVETAEAMLAALESRSWDLVLSDYSMPQFSAPDALAVVNRLELDVPFIIVSGTVGEDIAVEAMRSGASDYVLKGNLVRLCPAIARELREAQVRVSQRETERARRAIEARFRAIMETATDGVISVDGRGEITYSNPAAERIFGFRPGELFAERVTRLVPERFLRAEGGEFFEHLEREQRGALGKTVEIFGRRKDGSEFPMDLSLGSWTAGGERFFACIVRDVSERKQVEAQLLAADRMISVGTLTAGVAHEINNPLAAVMGNLDISVSDVESLTRLDTPEGVSALREQLTDARDAAARVRNIVRDLRMFSRADDEKRGAVDVKLVLDSTLRMASNEIRHRAQLVRDYADVPRVEANEGRLGQVFLNLIVNAAQAIGEGKADENEIRIATRMDAGRVVVEIGDTGPGIPPAVMARLFSPFVTTKPAGSGTGLGLSICHRIVSELGGEIVVSTQAGQGTTFRVSLPLATTDSDSIKPPPRSETRAARRGRVLVVDDEPMIADVVQRSLALEHDVIAVDRPRAALDLIRAGERFDVILCDLMMPDVTGMDFHEQLTQMAPEHASAVLFLTGGAFTPSARDFLAGVPANRRLEKPFDVSHLRAVINGRVR